MPTNPNHDIHQLIVEHLDAGRPLAVLVVVGAAGSTPRKSGTKALVDAEGRLWGTIGGGLLEARARGFALEAIATGSPRVFDFAFTGTDAAESFPVCGGTMRVLIDPAPQRHRQAYAAALQARQNRRSGWLVTSWSETSPPDIRVEWHEGGPAPAARSNTLLEPVMPAPWLIINGGGHVGQALARQADLVGFELLIIDDRAEFARPELFPAGAAVRCAQVGTILPELPLDSDTYIALVSRGHLTDADALAACIHRPAAYIGMMGSRRKVALLRKEFIQSGRATAEEFDRVHAPIGLDIGAETVPEIAASIVAELIAVRRKDSR